ncbi:hypothetical protein B566_EDAN007256 [Ephemera danica]|nr:hypothetical protein B566_EDAN007256 [Ephemera danica]
MAKRGLYCCKYKSEGDPKLAKCMMQDKFSDGFRFRKALQGHIGRRGSLHRRRSKSSCIPDRWHSYRLLAKYIPRGYSFLSDSRGADKPRNIASREGCKIVKKCEDVTVCCDVAEKRRLSLCVGCGAQIHDQYILRVAPDLEWHAACLKCAECHQFLDETCTCFVRDGKTYCKRDYVSMV